MEILIFTSFIKEEQDKVEWNQENIRHKQDRFERVVGEEYRKNQHQVKENQEIGEGRKAEIFHKANVSEWKNHYQKGKY